MNLRKNYFNIFIYAVKNIEDDDLKKNIAQTYDLNF